MRATSRYVLLNMLYSSCASNFVLIFHMDVMWQMQVLWMDEWMDESLYVCISVCTYVHL